MIVRDTTCQIVSSSILRAWSTGTRAHAVVGPHRIRPGQNVIVTDPKMEGFLPAPGIPLNQSHTPSEVLLRFSSSSPSTKSSAQPEIFLHGMAATATFGKDFGADSSTGFTPAGSLSLGGAAAILYRPKRNTDGCDAFPSSDIVVKAGKAPVLVLDRGECTFFHKALNARQAGAAGVIILGYPPKSAEVGGGEVGEVQEGLIRPSAEEEPDYLISQIGDDFGVLYVDWVVGQAVVEVMADQGKEVGVEMFDLMSMGTSGGGGGSLGGGGGDRGEAMGGGGVTREGRVMVAGWDIRNLRIVERPP